MENDEGVSAVDNIVTQFNTYEDFLDSQITTLDLYYLEDEDLARQLVELGYRGSGEVVKREDFEARKAAIEIARLAERTQKKTLASAGKELKDNFLKALAQREEDNRTGKVTGPAIPSLLSAPYKSSEPLLGGTVAASVSPRTTAGAGGSPGALEQRSGRVEGCAPTGATWLAPPPPNPLRRQTAPKLQGAQRPLAGSVVECTTITDSTTYSTNTSTTTRRPQRAGPTERSAARRSPTIREHHGAPPGQQEVPPPRRLGRTPPVPAPESDPPPPPPPSQPPQPPGLVEAPPPAAFSATVADVVAAPVAAADAAPAAPAALALHPAAAHLAGPPETALAVPAEQEAAVAQDRLPAQTLGVPVRRGAPAEGLAPPPRLLLLLGPGRPSAGAVCASQGPEGLPDAPPPLAALQQTALAIPAAAAPAPSGSLARRESPKALAHTQDEAPTHPGQGFGHQEDQEIQKNHRTFWKLHQLHQKSIIFIRDLNAHGQELSGYIDYAHRLKMEDFEVYFTGKRKLLPRPTDLSFYNWDSHVAILNSSPNYQVIAENCDGLLFKYKRDRKIINVDPKLHPGDNSTRTPIQTDLYLQVVIYDHVSRRKT